MAKKKIGDYVAEWMAELCKDNPYELSRTEFVKEAGTWYLRVFVDKIEEYSTGPEKKIKYGYMSSDDCELLSRFLSEKLDKEDPIPQNYYLEVSSPGMDRPLITDSDFLRFKGEAIEVKLYESINGSKMIEGILQDYKEGIITVADGNKVIELPREKAAKINLAVIF